MGPIPRHGRVATSKTSSMTLSASGLPVRVTEREYWFSSSARPSSSWFRSIEIACRMSTGSKPPTTIGTPNVFYQRFVLLESHHRADVAWRNEPLHTVGGRREDEAHGGGRQNVRRKHREVRQPLSLGPQHGHRICRRSRFESDAEEDHLARR